MKDDLDSYAVLPEHGSSQMAAARVVDVVARPPRCAGQAVDAVIAHLRSQKWRTLQHC